MQIWHVKPSERIYHRAEFPRTISPDSQTDQAALHVGGDDPRPYRNGRVSNVCV